MALLNGQKPEEIAKEIVAAAVKDFTLTVDGTVEQKLETVVRYLNRDKINAYSDAWYKSNRDSLMKSAVEQLIATREKQIVDYLADKETREKDNAFRMLISKGVDIPTAYAKIFQNK